MIKQAKELVNSAVRQLQKYQTGEDIPIKTRYDHFNENCLGGIFKGMIVTIAGVSGSGKSTLAQKIEEDIFNEELNPDAKDFVLLRCNWEMTVFRLLLRKLKRKVDKTMREILFNPPKEEEKAGFSEVCNTERSDRIFYMEEPTTPQKWCDTVSDFLSLQKDKKQVVITIDHIALVRDMRDNKKKAMDELVEHINILKKTYTNTSFILISQLNRDIEGRTDVRHLNPKRSDLYNTDSLFQISDLVLVIHNPYRLGHDKYMVVPGLAKDEQGNIKNPKYAYLANWMVKPENKLTNLKTKGGIFYHYLKIRELEDIEEVKDIHIEYLFTNTKREEPTIVENQVQDFEGFEEDDIPF